MNILKTFLFIFSIVSIAQSSIAQQKANLIYIDSGGVIRFTKNDQEAAFFGVNYTSPFAYAFRAQKSLNIDLEKAIQQDVYHMARLGLDAFRVHVWDTEITDSLGNLLNNEHLRLFDFLIAELKKRNIKTLVTPIAFWGNGYPERDEKTAGFSSIYNKEKILLNESAIRAQENYLKQFFEHVNPYTKLSYKDDADIIAAEINNEPSHSGPKEAVTTYINRLYSAIKNTGWTKPIFYNISQTPFYAAAVAASNADGYSFQWYPSGLVANREMKGNFLPNVDQYAIPYDTIPSFAKKPRIVYEFDAADILQSNMYPAIARSFRKAGFQWATQFAYDPMAIAYANTEYQTHYMNLAYTPAKAISLMIASKAFHKVPRFKSYGKYPVDSAFETFRVSYKENLSEMNSGREFYYSNSTKTKPSNLKLLKNIAGVGNSAIVNYKGYGAYFLDKLEDGVWRLEVMPDAIHIRDPFEKVSLKKEVTRIHWQNQKMQIILPDLGTAFTIKGLNDGNTTVENVRNNSFQIYPGTYLLTKKGKNASKWTSACVVGSLKLNEFIAPKSISSDVYLSHQPLTEVSADKAFNISAKLVGADSTHRVTLYANNLAGEYRTIQMTRKSGYDYTAEIPADILTPGMLSYRIVVQKGEEYSVFPGNHKGNPFTWDNYINETWSTFVAAPFSNLEIFSPTVDRNIIAYPIVWRGDVKSDFISGTNPRQLIWNISTPKLREEHTIGMQYFFADKIKGRADELSSFKKVLIRAKSSNETPVRTRVTLINKDAAAYTAFVMLDNNFKDFEIILSDFKPDSYMLLPRPYPAFMPLWFKASSAQPLKLKDMEKLEVTIGSDLSEPQFDKPHNLQIESVWLAK